MFKGSLLILAGCCAAVDTSKFAATESLTAESDFKKMKVAELRYHLARRSDKCDACEEKEEFRQRLRQLITDGVAVIAEEDMPKEEKKEKKPAFDVKVDGMEGGHTAKVLTDEELEEMMKNSKAEKPKKEKKEKKPAFDMKDVKIDGMEGHTVQVMRGDETPEEIEEMLKNSKASEMPKEDKQEKKSASDVKIDGMEGHTAKVLSDEEFAEMMKNSEEGDEL